MPNCRIRAPLPKPGELKVQWGKLPSESPGLCYVWGEGVPNADATLLHDVLSSPRYRPLQSLHEAPDPSFLKELEARGYDLSTLRFTIQKKQRSKNI